MDYRSRVDEAERLTHEYEELENDRNNLDSMISIVNSNGIVIHLRIDAISADIPFRDVYINNLDIELEHEIEKKMLKIITARLVEVENKLRTLWASN